MKHKVMIMAVMLIALSACSSEGPSSYPSSSASYQELNSEMGCDSKYSDAKKDDIFKSRYKNHWMTWSGEVVLADADDASLNIDGKGTQDLHVNFADKRAGYNLTKGNVITVRFVMKHAGGCILPFSGNYATIVR
jgi:predicted YcjX-like family ATPase